MYFDNPTSPIKASYDYVEKLKDVDVIFGSSKDPDDLKRWKTVTAYMDKNNPSITVLDPKTTAVNRLYSATDIRNKIDELNVRRTMNRKVSQTYPFKDNEVRFNNSTNCISFYENMIVLEKQEMPKSKEITKGQ